MGLNLQYKDGQTPLEEEEKEGLKIKLITTQGELNEFEQLNIEKAVEWTIRKNLNQEQILNEKFVKDLHKRMYGDVWKWAGQFRKSNKNIGVHWPLIAVELKNLIDDTKFWIEQNTYNAAEISIRFKHRIVLIHCFPNGNGRHSRLMADVIMAAIFNKDTFTWHRTNMVEATVTRKNYIAALRLADKGNIEPLIEFAKN